MRVEIAVVGGGPAGAAAAALLAKNGVEVALVEKARFPRHHVGESLQPACLELLDLHLGLGPALAAKGWQRKYGALYRWGDDDALWSVLFDPRLDADLAGLTPTTLAEAGYDHAFHVVRQDFDTLLLDEARARGVEVVEDRAVSFSAPHLQLHSGAVIQADLLLDASGQTALMARAEGLVRPVESLQAVATYGYLEHDATLAALPEPGFGALGREATLIVSRPDGWMWWIPVGPRTTSVGFVSRAENSLKRDQTEALVALAEASGLPVGDATVPQPLRTVRDWSYTTSRRQGDGWLAVGDAAGFVDPILSGGVDLAIRDALNAAMAVLRARERPQDADDLLRRYAAGAQAELAAYLRLARYWYGNNRSVDGFFWQARRAIAARSEEVMTPLRAFVYLTSGRYAADRHYQVFIEWQEQRIFEKLGVDQRALRVALGRVRPRKG